MEKQVGGFGWSWNGEWDLPTDNGARDPKDFNPDDIHSLFRVYALGDLGVREHCKQLDDQGNGMMTGLERLMFESCWPGAKVSRHEVNVSDGKQMLLRPKFSVAGSSVTFRQPKS